MIPERPHVNRLFCSYSKELILAEYTSVWFIFYIVEISRDEEMCEYFCRIKYAFLSGLIIFLEKSII